MSLTAAALHALVAQKRGGGEHTQEQIDALVTSYCRGAARDEDFAPWLRAVCERGLSDDETAWLTRAMASSGVVLSWDDVPGVVVDKHSTGGVGDDVSLIAVPLAAACGIKVAKLSGRALGHTGGTIDKLECVPNLRTDLAVADFKRQVAEVGCAIIQATEEIAPADRKIYALRHRTNTVESIGLIAASVLSKKIAGGAPNLVIDVTCGAGAFMRTPEQAHALALTVVQVCRRLGRAVTVLVTDMETPLSASIGDALELDESLSVLQGRTGGRLRAVALAVAEAMLAVHDADGRQGEPERMAALERALGDGSAYERFVAMAAAQGGDVAAFDREFTPAMTVVSPRAGFVGAIDGRAIGATIAAHKAERSGSRGRVGVRLRKASGDAVARGEPLVDIFTDDDATVLARSTSNAISIVRTPPPRRSLIMERMHARA